MRYIYRGGNELTVSVSSAEVAYPEENCELYGINIEAVASILPEIKKDIQEEILETNDEVGISLKSFVVGSENTELNFTFNFL